MPGRHAKPRPIRRRATATLGLTALVSGGMVAAAEYAGAAQPTLTTQASGPIALGGPGVLIDTATVSNRMTLPDPNGKVTFKLYGPDNSNCSGPAISTSVANLANNGANPPSVASDPVVPTAPGTYRWVATYTGQNDPISTSCGDANETTVVSKAVSSVTTVASPGFTIGSQPGQLTDTVTVTGYNPTGKVVFEAYGPDDTNCSITPPIFSTQQIDYNNAPVVSPAFVPATAGTYRWRVKYSGDTKNLPAESNCNAANELVTVTKATPKIETSAGANLANGTLTDSAKVTERVLPQETGSVTFKAYPPTDPTCAGQPVFTSTKPLPASETEVDSDPFTPTVIGTYRWVATYSGDANNITVSGACGDATETTAVSAVGPGPVVPPGATCLGETATIVYGPGDDEIEGTSGRDVIVAGGGDDIVYGRGGRDVICGGAGNDAISGGGGSDEILGEGGNDTVFGGNGHDQIGGGADDDELHGDDGDDLLDGGPGQDFCTGGAGSDITESCS